MGGDMPRMGVRPVGLGSGQDLVLCDVASRLPSLNGVFSPGGPSQLCCAWGRPPESGCHMALFTHSGHQYLLAQPWGRRSRISSQG